MGTKGIYWSVSKISFVAPKNTTIDSSNTSPYRQSAKTAETLEKQKTLLLERFITWDSIHSVASETVSDTDNDRVLRLYLKSSTSPIALPFVLSPHLAWEAVRRAISKLSE